MLPPVRSAGGRGLLAAGPSNATLAARAAAVDNPAFNVVSGVVHVLYLLLVGATTLLWARHLRFRYRITKSCRQISDGQWFVFLCTLMATLHEVSYLAFAPGGFARAGGVVGAPGYTPAQFGYLNSGPTPLCAVSAVLLYFSLSSMMITLCFLTRNAYRLASRVGPSHRGGRANSLLDVGGPWWRRLALACRRNPLYVVGGGVPPLASALQVALADQGPMGSYCGIRCKERHVDARFTSEGRCWVRLPAFYLVCMVVGLLCMYYCVRLVLHIRAVHRMSAKAGNRQAVQAARNSAKGKESARLRDRLIVMAFFLGACTAGAGVARIRSSLDPQEDTEGTVGLTEFFPLIITPMVIFTFSTQLWADACGCSARVARANAKFVRRHSYSHGSGSQQRASSSQGGGAAAAAAATAAAAERTGDVSKHAPRVPAGAAGGAAETATVSGGPQPEGQSSVAEPSSASTVPVGDGGGAEAAAGAASKYAVTETEAAP